MAELKTSDGINLYYEVAGEGDPIVLVHGWGQSNEGYIPQMEELNKRFKVISYDLRGHGKSDKPQYGLTLSRFADDLEELMKELAPGNVTLVGWSMGASTSFEYVKKYGVGRLKSLTIFDMTPKLLNDEEWKLGLFHGKYKIGQALQDLTALNDDYSVFGKEFMAIAAPYFTEEMLEETNKLFVESNTPHVLAAMWLAMAVNDYREVLPKITVPTQIVYGEQSTLYSKETAEYLASQIPNVTVIPFENCTHLLVAENPDKTTEVINEIANLSSASI